MVAVDDRRAMLVTLANGDQGSQLLNRLPDQTKGIAPKEIKSCSSNKYIRSLNGFLDPALKCYGGGYGCFSLS